MQIWLAAYCFENQMPAIWKMGEPCLKAHVPGKMGKSRLKAHLPHLSGGRGFYKEKGEQNKEVKGGD